MASSFDLKRYLEIIAGSKEEPQGSRLTQDLLDMSLSEFEESGKALLLYSEPHNEYFYIVAKSETAPKDQPQIVKFDVNEIRILWHASKLDTELFWKIHLRKKTFKNIILISQERQKEFMDRSNSLENT